MATTQPIFSLSELGPAGIHTLPVDSAQLSSAVHAATAIPHRHDHYSCFLIEQGSLDLVVDFTPVHLPAASLLVSYPGQVHQTVAANVCRGWGLVADAKLVGQHARHSIEQLLSNVALLYLSEVELTWFQHVFQALHQAGSAPVSPLFQAEVLQGLLNACLGRAAALLEAQPHQPSAAHSQRGLVLTKQFRQLLQQHYLTCKKPADYADKLHLTVSYLNDTVKAVTGFSVSHFIQQQVLAEAQRLLFHTALSIKEVASQLGYDDYKYFIRLFTKGTGVSPTLFRRNLGARHPA